MTDTSNVADASANGNVYDEVHYGIDDVPDMGNVSEDVIEEPM